MAHHPVAPQTVVLLLMAALGCGSGTPTEPSSTLGSSPSTNPGTIPLPGNEVLTGQVTDRMTSAPIPGATIVFSQPHPSPRATTDGSGNYSLSGLPAPGGGAFVWAMADGYEEDIRYYRAAAQNFRLYPIELIPAGGSTLVTVRPDDSLCWNNTHEPGYGSDLVCRLVRVEPINGMLTDGSCPHRRRLSPPSCRAGQSWQSCARGAPRKPRVGRGERRNSGDRIRLDRRRVADGTFVHADDVDRATMTGASVITLRAKDSTIS